MEFYEKFQELLNEKKVTIADIANATGLSYPTVDSIIKKKIGKKITLNTAIKIADFFDVDVKVFVYRDYIPTRIHLPTASGMVRKRRPALIKTGVLKLWKHIPQRRQSR